jgi:hypothetical protein
MGGYSFEDLLIRVGHHHSLTSEVSVVACRAACVDIAFISLLSCYILIDLVVSDLPVDLIPNT